MKRKILRCLWLIPFIGGLCLGFAGIAKVKAAKEMYVPEMTEEGWFDASTKQSHAEVAGNVMIVIGFGFLSLIGSLSVGFIIKGATTTPEEEAAAAAKEINATKRYKQKLKELTGASDEEIEKFDEDAEDDEDVDDDEDLDDEDIQTNSKTKKQILSTAKQQKFCAFCGSANTARATKCSSCGASFTAKSK